ncbi:hypothetical protein BIV57_00450 [Mangrovactinospora gilvigrisea]|uniref:GAF domain-containing protein n=1 Tax=Mangrovactinospora gilvigrisea TaxID=1428644 RepID=A0A1J7BKZ0_9ACTN|nr:GAF domain-containing protein [Mangrovactinospora gilvigrisea]OIV39351.1 hypothetical protein BIV57_00450 [Mangrovactinospora gilvigrisea]
MAAVDARSEFEPRLDLLLAEVDTAPGGIAGLDRIRAKRWAVLGMDGLALSLLGTGRPELVWWRDEGCDPAGWEDAQYLVGEGPTADAAVSGCPVVVGDVQGEAQRRWPVLLADARARGRVRAVVAVPIVLAGTVIGVLAGQRLRPGPVDPDRVRAVRAVAEAIGGLVVRSPGEVPPLHRAVVHQAAGAVAVLTGLPMEAAADRVLAHLFATGQELIRGSARILQHPNVA